MIKRYLIFAVAIGYASLANAGGIEQFKSFIRSTKTAKGEFVQRQMKMLNGKPQLSIQSNGTFMFARPGKFIWFYQKPYEQLLQADGENFYLYDKDLNQVTIKSLGTALSSSPAAILFGSNELEKNFTLKNVGEKDGMEFLQAIPKDKDSSFSAISIGMQNGVPRELDLRDNFNQTTVILLQKFEKNPASMKSEAELFKFTVPAGADVFNS